jgi:hypothetical protein
MRILLEALHQLAAVAGKTDFEDGYPNEHAYKSRLQ